VLEEATVSPHVCAAVIQNRGAPAACDGNANLTAERSSGVCLCDAAGTPFLTPQFVAGGASTAASTPAAFGSPQETLEEQAAAETAVLKERVAVLEAENESLRHTVDSVTADDDVDAHHSQLVLSLKREVRLPDDRSPRQSASPACHS